MIATTMTPTATIKLTIVIMKGDRVCCLLPVGCDCCAAAGLQLSCDADEDEGVEGDDVGRQRGLLVDLPTPRCISAFPTSANEKLRRANKIIDRKQRPCPCPCPSSFLGQSTLRWRQRQASGRTAGDSEQRQEERREAGLQGKDDGRKHRRGGLTSTFFFLSSLS